jgi:hypothetical protein
MELMLRKCSCGGIDMKRIFVTAFPLILTFATALKGGTDIPEKFSSKNPYRIAPVWISGRAALEHGSLRPGSLADHEASYLREQLRQTPSPAASRSEPAGAEASGPCEVTFGALFDDVPMPSSKTLDDVRRYASSQSLVEGIVVASEVGFYSGTPFTLTQVRVTRASKSDNIQTAYLLLPKGTLSIEGQTVCTSDPRYGAVPANGDTVLFVTGPPVDVDGTLFRIPSEHLFVWHRDVLIVPARLATSGLRDVSLRHLRDLLEHTQSNIQSNGVRP